MAEMQKYRLKEDPQGMVGRECPQCKTYFKVDEAEVDVESMTCPVCGTNKEGKKFTTEPQVDYINTLIFHKNECPIDELNGYSKVKPCHDYVEMPARSCFTCNVCGKKFGLDDKNPEFCPYCGATHEHFKLDETCNVKSEKKN
jgi:rubrerythrin